MKRIYSNYSDEDYDLISKKANEMGVSMSSFQRYCVDVFLKGNGKAKLEGEMTVTEIRDIIVSKLAEFPSGKMFYVSMLFSEEQWEKMTRSEKATASKQLSIYVGEHLDMFKKNKYKAGRTTLYEKN